MDWTPVHYILLTIGLGAVAVAITLLAAAWRVRLVWFASASLLVCAAAIGYVLYLTTDLPPLSARHEPAAPRSQQPAGESTAGRSASGSGVGETERAQDIQQSEHPAPPPEPRRQKVREALSRLDVQRTDKVDFSLVVGAAVPHDVMLHDLPNEVADALGGFNGDQYLLVRDQLVIVDRASRRIVALVPGVA